MAWDEEACSFLCFTVCDLPVDQSRASEAVWFTSAVGDTVVKVGAYYDGLCGWIVEVTCDTLIFLSSENPVYHSRFRR